MTSDRMMQAIGRIERAISRIEAGVGKLRARANDSQAELEQLRQSRAEGLLGASATPDPHAMNPYSHDKALAALRSLDSLIDDLQKARRDG